MKKLVSICIVIIVLLNLVMPVMADNNAQFVSFEADTFDVHILNKTTVTFTAIMGNIGAYDISVYDEQDNFVVKLDKVGENEYSSSAELYEENICVHSYYAMCLGVKSDAFEIGFYDDITKEDMEKARKVWENIYDLREEADDMGIDEQIQLVLIDTLIGAQNGISKSTKGLKTVEFTMKSGISGVVDISLENEMVNNYESEVKLKSYPTWENPDILVVRPYRNSGQVGFYQDLYIQMAESISSVTHGNIVDLKDGETNPLALRENFYKSGIILVDSHGIYAFDKSYIAIMDGEGYDSSDLSAGRIIQVGGGQIGITGSYFTKYYKQEKREFNKTVFYFGICDGFTTNALYKPLLNLGGVAYIGYVNPVSFEYENNMCKYIWSYMVAQNDNDRTRGNTYEEALEYAKSVCGETDYIDEEYEYDMDEIAYACLAGDGDFVLTLDRKIEGIEAVNSEIEVNIGETAQIEYITTPVYAENYLVTYESENQAIAKVSSRGVVEGIGEGETNIIIKGIDKQSKAEYKGIVKVNVKYVPVDSVKFALDEIKILKGGYKKILYYDIYPLNASYQDVKFESSDENIVKVSKGGEITSVNAGEAFITIITADGEYKDMCRIEVRNKAEYTYEKELIDENKKYVMAYNNLVLTNTKIGGNVIAHYPAMLDGETLTGAYLFEYEWSFIKNNDKYYIYNDAVGYMDIDSNGRIGFSEMPISEFEYDFNKMQLKYEDKYLAFLNDGFLFYASEDKAINIKLYYEKDAEYYVVMFMLDDNTVISEYHILDGEKVTAPIPPEFDDKVFIGWNKDFSNITGDTVITAIYALRGDANIDNVIDSADATVILRHVAKLDILSGGKELAADMNADKIIDSADATLVLRFVAGLF